MILERFVSGRARSNAYVFAPDADGRCVVVDPGAGAARPLVVRIAELELQPEAILLTHGHPDHVWSARALCRRYDVAAYLHPADRRWLPPGKRPDRIFDIADDQILEVAGAELSVMHTPGHTRGGVCYLTAGVCFTGDTVFARRPGHTIYPGGDRRTLQRSIATRILTLPDDVQLVPGHGPQARVGDARGFLESFVGRTQPTTGT